MSTIYRHSGALTFAGVVAACGAGIAGGSAVGAAYSIFMNYVPYLLLHLFATIGFGIGVGYLAGTGAKVGKLRSTGVLLAISAISALVSLYISWCVDRVVRLSRAGVAVPFDISPVQIARYAAAFYEKGAWGLKGWVVSGPLLAAFWILEAATVVSVAMGIAHSILLACPFCELCNVWTRRLPFRTATARDSETTIRRIRSGDLSLIKQLAPEHPTDGQYLKFEMAKCPRCSDTAYLTISMVTTDSKRESVLPLVKDIYVGPFGAEAFS